MEAESAGQEDMISSTQGDEISNTNSDVEINVVDSGSPCENFFVNGKSDPKGKNEIEICIRILFCRMQQKESLSEPKA